MLELHDFAHIFERSPLAHLVMDRDDTIVLVNEAFCQFIGHGKEELTEMKFTDTAKKVIIQVLSNNLDWMKKSIYGEPL